MLRTRCWPLLILLWCAAAWSSETPESWEARAQRVLSLAENDVPQASVQVEELARALPEEPSAKLQVQLLNLRARIETYESRTNTARLHVDQALALAKKIDDPVGQATAHLNLVLIATNQGLLDTAAQSSIVALSLLRGLNQPRLLCEALLRNSMMYRRNGQIDSAMSVIMKARELARKIADPLALAYVYQGLGITFETSENPGGGAAYFVQMRAYARAANSKQLEAFAILGEANSEFNRGNHEVALTLTREAITLFKETGAAFNLAHSQFSYAFFLNRMGQYQEALDALHEVLDIYSHSPNPLGLWWTRQAMASNLRSLNRAAEAEVETRTAYEIARQVNFPLYLAESAKSMARVAESHGDYRHANAFLRESLEMNAQAEQQRVSEQTVLLAERYLSESKQKQIDELTRREGQRTLYLRWLWTVLLASLTLLGLAAFFIHRQRRLNGKLSQTFHLLQQSRRQLQATLEAVPDPLLILDEDSRCVDSHLPSSDRLPLDFMERWRSKTAREVLPSEAADSCVSALKEAANHGTSSGQQFKMESSEGSRWFELSVACKQVPPGEKPRFVVLARDITERKRMESELAQREWEFRTLAENAPDIIIRYDKEARVVYVNRAYQEAARRGIFPSVLEAASSSRIQTSWGNEQCGYPTQLREVIRSGSEAEIRLARILGDSGIGHYSFRIVAERATNSQVNGALAIGRDITALIEAEEKLKLLSLQLRELAARRDTAREEERKRIARELHDELGQTLTAFRLDVATMKVEFGADNPGLDQRCQYLLQLSDRTIQEVRSVASSLRPAALDMGTVPALEWLAAEFRARTSVECRLDITEDPVRLDEAQSVAIFRIVQESLTNVTRHAGASRVDISLRVRDSRYQLRISDNGVGFLVGERSHMSFGLMGIRERALMINGEASVIGVPGEGTTVEVCIPVS